MHGLIAPTDKAWYDQLRLIPDLDEVNFWLPSARTFKALHPGQPLIFKLKSPHNTICGFGIFARHTILPDWLAWEAFGQKNGAANYASLHTRLLAMRRRNKIETRGDIEIGCILLTQPVLFPPELWIPQPTDWRPRTVSYTGYDLAAGEGQRVWHACLDRAQLAANPGLIADINDPPARYGTGHLVRPRLGQGTFRIGVTDAYHRACAVTGEHTLPVLEAAHIRPYAAGGVHDISNGLLLRTDVHKLYDKGFVTVTADHRFQVSEQIHEMYRNGRAYYDLADRQIALPSDPTERPNREALDWHARTCFRDSPEYRP